MKTYTQMQQLRLLPLALLTCTASSLAQTAVQTPPAMGKPITASNLLDREYTATWPQPSFPSAPRKAKQFSVEYVYRYAESDYAPAAKIEQIKHSDATQDTPEHTLVAFISAVKTLDYDWWLSLWDAKSQQLIADVNKTQKRDPAFWKASWQQAFVGKPVTLYSRLEMVHDIVLEYSLGEQHGQKGATLPLPMRRENGKWVLTMELGDSGFVPWMGQQALSAPIDFSPEPKYSGIPAPPIVSRSQELFFRNQSRGVQSATEFVW